VYRSFVFDLLVARLKFIQATSVSLLSRSFALLLESLLHSVAHLLPVLHTFNVLQNPLGHSCYINGYCELYIYIYIQVYIYIYKYI